VTAVPPASMHDYSDRSVGNYLLNTGILDHLTPPHKVRLYRGSEFLRQSAQGVYSGIEKPARIKLLSMSHKNYQ
jgi:hypothetical protein